jgi:hypothetical protein
MPKSPLRRLPLLAALIVAGCQDRPPPPKPAPRVAPSPRARSPVPDADRIHGHTPAEYAQHAAALKEKLGSAYSVVIEPPFVVAGDTSEERVRDNAEGVVRWATTMLEQDFFVEEPKRILDVLLFSNAKSYRQEGRAELTIETEPAPQ